MYILGTWTYMYVNIYLLNITYYCKINCWLYGGEILIVDSTSRYLFISFFVCFYFVYLSLGDRRVVLLGIVIWRKGWVTNYKINVSNGTSVNFSWALWAELFAFLYQSLRGKCRKTLIAQQKCVWWITELTGIAAWFKIPKFEYLIKRIRHGCCTFM